MDNFEMETSQTEEMDSLEMDSDTREIGQPLLENENGWWSEADRFIDEVVWGIGR